MSSILLLRDYFLKATEAAAIASGRMRGCEDNKAADAAAVEAMRKVFDTVPFNGRVAIGEGERDEAPMLYIGEPLGSQQGDPLALAADIAVDPLECTNHCAQDKPDALSVLAAAPRGALLHAPDCYMNKIAGSSLLKGRISLDTPVGDNLNAVSDVMGKPLSEITVIVMDRSRHIELISKIEGAGSKVRLIGDGDIAGALRAVEGEVDLLMGIGAAPEGVIAATAIKALGGVFESRLHFHKPEFRERAEKMMDDDVDRLWTEQDLCQSDDTLFVATGVCDGWLPEVSFEDGVIKTTSKIINGSDGSVEVITTNHEE
tara:strand:+ start:9329 stop:10276 length:948 start_codon:yes stop_codon:yes gene_type:complete